MKVENRKPTRARGPGGRALRVVVMLTSVMALVASCASPPSGNAPTSSAETTRLLMGRWFQVDTVGGFELPHRLELIFAADGTCAYNYIPKDPAKPRGVRRGTWRLEDGGFLVFQWGPHSLGLDYRVESGRIHRLDRRQLTIAVSEPHPSFLPFYRSYNESLVKVPGSGQATQ